MNFDHLEAIHAARDLGLRLQPADAARVDISIHPPFTDLRSVQTVVEGEAVPVALGAQNCAVEDAGAFTGEVSPLMLAKLHVEYVIVGHSERRRLFGETDEMVGAKLAAVLRNGMTPICCVGETLEEHQAGMTKERLSGQVEAIVAAAPRTSVGGLVLAYEPIWAIGTGEAADTRRTRKRPARGSARSWPARREPRSPTRSGSSTEARSPLTTRRSWSRARTSTVCWWAAPASTAQHSSGSSRPRAAERTEFGSVSHGSEAQEDVRVLTAIIVVLQILCCVALIFLILMHSGKGGGLSDMFGGSVGSAAAGSTVVEKNLDRITVTVAVIFAFTNIILILRLQ